jgi:hypothetical protein
MSPISCEALLSVGRRPANLRHQAQARIDTAMEAGNRLCHWCDGRDQRPAAPAGPGHQGDGISGGRCSSACLPPSTMWCNQRGKELPRWRWWFRSGKFLGRLLARRRAAARRGPYELICVTMVHRQGGAGRHAATTIYTKHGCRWGCCRSSS